MNTAFANIDQNRLISDRFIPLRSSINDNVGYLTNNQFSNEKNLMDDFIPKKQRLFNYNKSLRANQNQKEKEQIIETKKRANLPKKPVKVLEAPGLLDDYYLNLVCWGKSNLIAVGLEDSVYFFNFLNNSVKKHLSLPQVYSEEFFDQDSEFSPYICSLSFNDDGQQMAVADSNGQIMITDV